MKENYSGVNFITLGQTYDLDTNFAQYQLWQGLQFAANLFRRGGLK